MKLRYIEAWSIDLEIDEDTLREYGLDGLTPDEVAYELNRGNCDFAELIPELFDVRSDGKPGPADGFELDSTEWVD